MKNGMYTMKHYLPVVMTMQGGETKDATDTLTVTFLYWSDEIHILTMSSKLDNGQVNLPPEMLHNMLEKMKEKAATIE